jgi:putative addiction module antidote
MALVRVRKQGNSTVVTLAQEVVERARLNDGDLIEETVDARGRVVLQAVSVEPRVRPKMAAAIKSAARDKRAVLRRLAEYERR